MPIMTQEKTQTDLYIRQLGFWPHLSTPEKALLNNNTRTVRYAAGAQVHQGTLDCIGVLLVKSGQLRVYSLSEDGRDVTLYRLFAGDVAILSASCVLEAVTFPVNIDAEEDTEVLRIDASTFRQLAQNNVYVRCFGYEKAAGRLSDMLWKMQQILFLSADKRLAIFLLEESEKTGSDTIHLTHEQIARYMGSAREVVSRLVKYFSQEGWVKSGRGHLTILDKEALATLSGKE